MFQPARPAKYIVGGIKWRGVLSLVSHDDVSDSTANLAGRGQAEKKLHTSSPQHGYLTTNFCPKDPEREKQLVDG